MKQLSLFAAALTAALGACTTGDVDPDRMLEPTTFKVRIENVAPWTVLKAGTHETKVTGQAGPLQSGESFEIPFTAGANQRVSFVAMLGQSNDWFFAPKPEGIALYDDAGNPRSGNVTSEIFLFDAGSEIDQEPAVGDATGPRQPAPDFGAPDPIAMVRQLAKTVPLTAGGTFTLPNIADMIQVTLVPGANRQFTLRITNVSTATTLVTSQGSSAIGISPAVWALHIAPAPVFAEGVADRAQGLELVAESGRGAMLGSAMTALAGAARCDHAARDPAGRRSRLARRRDPRRDLGRGRLRRWLQPVVRGAATARTDPRGGGAAPGAGDRGDRWRRAARRADHDAPAGCGRRDRRRHRARRARATPRLKAARPPVRTVE